MADVAFLVLVIAFFALAALYVRGCERIVAPGDDPAQADDGR